MDWGNEQGRRRRLREKIVACVQFSSSTGGEGTDLGEDWVADLPVP